MAHKLIFALALVVFALGCASKHSYKAASPVPQTSNYQFNLPPRGYQPWDQLINSNFSALDGYLFQGLVNQRAVDPIPCLGQIWFNTTSAQYKACPTGTPVAFATSTVLDVFGRTGHVAASASDYGTVGISGPGSGTLNINNGVTGGGTIQLGVTIGSNGIVINPTTSSVGMSFNGTNGGIIRIFNSPSPWPGVEIAGNSTANSPYLQVNNTDVIIGVPIGGVGTTVMNFDATQGIQTFLPFAFGRKVTQTASGKFSGTCTFSSGTTCTCTYLSSTSTCPTSFTAGFTSTPTVFLQPVGSDAVTFSLTSSSNTGFTITASGTTSEVVNWAAFGNPK